MRKLCYAILVLLLLASCRDKVICSAFQSTYILDDSVRSTYHSYLWYLDEEERKAHLASNAKIPPPNDSLGLTVASADAGGGVDYWEYTSQYKVLPRETRKTKYGIAKQWPLIPNFVRNQRLKTSPWENVLTPPGVGEDKPEEENVLSDNALDPLDSTARVSVADSLSVPEPADSATLAQEDKQKEWERFKYGFDPMQPMQPDQEYYFRKYGWLLQNAPPPPVDSTALDTSLPDSLQSDTTARKGLRGLFGKNKSKKEKKKKNKEEVPEGPENNEEATTSEENEEGNPDGSN